MSSNNPNPNPIQETTTGSDNNTLEDPQSVEDSQESKKNRPRDDPAELPEAEEEEEGSASPSPPAPAEEGSGRERLKRHRVEMAGRVWIPDMWGHEELLKDWADCTNFDASLLRSTILMARDSLANDGRRVHSTELTLHTSC